MITLYQAPKAWGLPNMSPFCIKVETYLRMVGLPYQTRSANPRRAPKGKVPYIRDGQELVADSTLILEYLKRSYGDKLDGELSAEQHATARALCRMLEEGTYWVGLYGRWAEDQGWIRVKAVLQPLLPPMLSGVLLPLTRSSIIKALHAQGTGRHSRDEIYRIGEQDLNAVATLLQDKLYLLGDQPTSYDACVYAFLISLLRAPFETPLKRYSTRFDNLRRYCDRMTERFFAADR